MNSRCFLPRCSQPLRRAGLCGWAAPEQRGDCSRCSPGRWERNIRQRFKGYCCLASDLWHAGKILMCHAAGGKESGTGVMNKKEFAYPISVSFWIWLELAVVRLCLSLVFTNASLTAEGQNQLLFCLQGLSFFREALQCMFFKPFSFQLRQQTPF